VSKILKRLDAGGIVPETISETTPVEENITETADSPEKELVENTETAS
jgi:hypothetical protein